MPSGVLTFMPPPVESSVELPDDEDTIDELDSSDIFDGFDGDNMLSMCPFEGTTCCSIVFMLVDEGGELEDACKLDEALAGTSDTSVEPSELVIRLPDCFS